MTEPNCSSLFEQFRRQFPEAHQFITSALRDSGARGLRTSARLRLLLAELMNIIMTDVLDTQPGAIVPLSKVLADTARIANRTVSFLLDDVHFGTGILIGPSSVLTAAHLFFEKDGRLIDRHRLSRIRVELHTAFFENFLVQGGEPTPVRLASVVDDEWLIDPKMKGDVALRDVDLLDFAIVKLDTPVGKEIIGLTEPRGWCEVPTVESAPLLARDLPLRVFQFVARKELTMAAGFVRSVTDDRFAVLHTASTLDSASGSGMFDFTGNLAAIHLSGSASGERPRSNRGLPIRRVAEIIDASVNGSPTIRSRIK